MSRQEKLASWQQLKADKRSANVLPVTEPVNIAAKEPVNDVEVPLEEPVVQEPVLQKFGKKKKAEE